MDIKALLSELVEVEYIAIRVELYIKPTDDIKSKLSSGLILNRNLVRAYKEKNKGLRKYYNDFQYVSNFIDKEYIDKMNNMIYKNINNTDDIIAGLEAGIDKDKLALLIKEDQDIYVKLVHNNNIIMNNLADRYLKNDHEPEEIMETNAIIEESNNNDEINRFNNEETKTIYKEYTNIENVDIRKLYLFQISEIEKAISEIEGKNQKTRKDINELYQYHNEILKIKNALSQYQ